MKICILTWFFEPHIGGVESLALDQAKYLVSEGHQVTVITSKYKSSLKNEDHGPLNVFRTDYLSPALNDAVNAEKLEKWLGDRLSRDKPDLLHAHNLTYIHGPKRSEAIYKICKGLNIPIIEHCHNAQQSNPEITKKLVALEWNKVICVSDYSRKKFIEQGGDAQKIEVIYNCADSELFDPNRTKPNAEIITAKRHRKAILFPARIFNIKGELNPHKPIEPLLKVLKEIMKKGRKDFVLVVIANETLGPTKKAEKKLIQLIEFYGLENNFIQIEEVPHRKMSSVYKSCDLVIEPFPEEAFGLTFVEAMLSEKPPIVPQTGAAPEVIEDKITGFVVDINDTKSMADLTVGLLEKKRELTKMGKMAREKALKKFDVKVFGKKLMKIYKEIT